MNEQLAAIRARREAVTPGVWEVGSMYTTGDAVVGVTDNRIVCVLGAEEQCHADATFIAAAPGDIDTLLAMVDALAYEYYLEHGREWNGLANIKVDMGVGESYTVIDDRELAAVTAERDALREQLQQAQRELAQERAIMNMVPEYIRYLAEWRAGDGRFLVFNEWVTQRVEQAQPQATATAERDDYRARFRDLEHELQLERGQVVAQQQRREAAEAALDRANDKIKQLEQRLGIYST